MSSIVRKKGTQFTPKLKKNVVRRRGTQAESTASPQAESSKDNTPESSQIKFFTKTQDEAKYDDIDPHDKSKTSAVAEEDEDDEGEEEEDEDDEDDDDDNDIFKKPSESLISRRKSSTVSQGRRLSSISGRSRPGSRTASISLSVPDFQPSKRRRSSVHRGAMDKRMSISQPDSTQQEPTSIPIREPNHSLEPVSVTDITNEEGQETVEPTTPDVVEMKLKSMKRDDLYRDGLKIVYGYDPDRRVFVQYRTGEVDEEELSNSAVTNELPLAPEEVITTVTDLSLLPKSLFDASPQFGSQLILDVNHISMKDLCRPNLPIGKVSSDFQHVKQAKEREAKEKSFRKNARIRARALKISYEDAFEDVLNENNISTQDQDTEIEKPNVESSPSQKSTIQLELKGSNIGFNTESTQVHRESALGYDNRERQETNVFEHSVTSNTYSKKRYVDKWSKEELFQFYEALSTWGTDFSFIADLFPHRTRKQVKLKFISEEKNNPELIDIALNRKTMPDLEKHTSISNIKYAPKEDFEKQLRKVRQTFEDQKREIIKSRERALKEDAETNRQKEIQRRTGSKPIPRLSKTKELRKNEEMVGTIDRKP